MQPLWKKALSFTLPVFLCIGAVTYYTCTQISPSPSSGNPTGAHDARDFGVEASQVYGADESVEALASSAQTGETRLVQLSNPTAAASERLFPEVDRDQLSLVTDSGFDDFTQSQFGYTVDADGTITPGFSYVLVSVDLHNKNDENVCVGLNSGGFFIRGEDGSLAPCQDTSPLWVNGKKGAVAKDFFIVALDPHETLSVDRLYVLSKEALADPGLVFLVDTGISTESAMEGMKAYHLEIHGI